jgi:hypothetical protein
MMKAGVIIHCLAAILIALSAGCATNGYWPDRRRDAMDIVTLQVGYGLGGKARVGPLQSGALLDVGGPGIRGGDFMGMEDLDDDGKPAKLDVLGVLIGAESFYGTKETQVRQKSFSSGHFALITWPWRREDLKWRPVSEPASFFTQIDVVGAAGLSFRFGFNPGEFLDFVLGCCELDIYHDDLSHKDHGLE